MICFRYRLQLYDHRCTHASQGSAKESVVLTGFRKLVKLVRSDAKAKGIDVSSLAHCEGLLHGLTGLKPLEACQMLFT